MKRLRQVTLLLLIAAAILGLSNCAAQHKHHKAIPCPCEKQNKR